MHNHSISAALTRAAETCAASGGRLTEKRRHILEILLNAGSPLSAYEIADAYLALTQQVMPAMSVYRILDYLASANLVHKLASNNKYIACAHIACDHAHTVPQFLICRRCNQVKEININRAIILELQESCRSAGYHLESEQLELDCLCNQCVTQAGESNANQ